MKSLNDLIWDKDSDLEEGKKDAVIKSRMNEICILNSCNLPPTWDSFNLGVKCNR